MRKYIFIGCGSFLGAALRYWVKGIQIFKYHGNIPLNTLFINIGGAFFLAFILTMAFEIVEFDSDMLHGITLGFLGAFTTFSALCKETAGLLYSGNYFCAISYMTATIMLGLGAAYLGNALARGIGMRVFIKEKS